MTKKKLDTSFFARNPEEVAEDLLGKVMFTEFNNGHRLEAVLWRIGAYQGLDRKTDKRIVQAPGIVNISHKHGYIVDICTEAVDVPSCVTLFGYVDGDQKVKGSVKTSHYLGIDKFNKGLIDGAALMGSRHFGIYEQPRISGFQVGTENPIDKGANCQKIYFIDGPI